MDASTLAHGRAFRPQLRFTRGFTLIELILVMAILTIAVSLTAPVLSNFFHGRSLDSEARRLLALTHQGQTRAVSESVPMNLWIDASQGAYGLEAESSYESTDSKAVDVKIDSDMQIAIENNGLQNTGMVTPATTVSLTSSSSHSNLPGIRFLPDGSIAESSPQAVRLTGRDGVSLWLTQARNHLNYEIRSQLN